jgi:hypothetical protein
VPAWVVVRVGDRTGVVRAQDEWVPDVRSAVAGSGGATAREAWRTSFREEPARLLAADQPRGGDPRLASMLAVVLAAFALARRARDVRARLLLAGLVLPPAVTTVVFGGPHVLGLALLLAGVAAAQRFRGAPVVSVVAWAAIALLPGVARVLEVGPGYGLVNLWTYHGRRPGALATGVLAALVLAAIFALVRRRTIITTAPAVAGALAAMVGLLIAPSASPDAVLVPLGLLVASAGVAEARPSEVT